MKTDRPPKGNATCVCANHNWQGSACVYANKKWELYFHRWRQIERPPPEIGFHLFFHFFPICLDWHFSKCRKNSGTFFPLRYLTYCWGNRYGIWSTELWSGRRRRETFQVAPKRFSAVSDLVRFRIKNFRPICVMPNGKGTFGLVESLER